MAEHQHSAGMQTTAASWLSIEIVGDYLENDLLRVSLMVGQPIRILRVSEQGISIELYCQNGEKSEAVFRHALTDQRLRRELEQRANRSVAELVDAVIWKVSGH